MRQAVPGRIFRFRGSPIPSAPRPRRQNRRSGRHPVERLGRGGRAADDPAQVLRGEELGTQRRPRDEPHEAVGIRLVAAQRREELLHLRCWRLQRRELVELVTEYLDGALPETERARFEAHVVDCPYCGIYLEQMRQTIRLVGRLSKEQIDPEATVELLRRFRAWKQG